MKKSSSFCRIVACVLRDNYWIIFSAGKKQSPAYQQTEKKNIRCVTVGKIGLNIFVVIKKN
jgi:hypothetical protein